MDARLELVPQWIEEASNEILLGSIAMSLKRIADALSKPNEFGEIGDAAIAGSIKRGMQNGR